MKKTLAYLFFTSVTAVSASAQLTGPLNMTGAQSNFAQYLSRTAADKAGNVADNGVVTSFNDMENTKGERFLFNTWVSGSGMIDAQGQAVNSGTYLFNFDKLTGGLLVTENKKDMMLVASTGVKSFMLESKGKQYRFQHVPLIDATKFYLHLAGSDILYSLYKECSVRFVKSNYRDDGMIQTGKPYDEYLDNSLYYLILPNENTFRVVPLKPKEIKNLLLARREKVNAYFSQHRDDEINETFLTGLIYYINQP